MAKLELYPFRFRDPLTGKWVRARHKLQIPEIQCHYSDWEITGAPEIRHVTETGAQPLARPQDFLRSFLHAHRIENGQRPEINLGGACAFLATPYARRLSGALHCTSTAA